MTQENLNMIMNVIIMLSAVYLICIGATLKTKNFSSSLLFKALPILLGILLFFILFIRFGFIVFGLGWKIIYTERLEK